MFRSEKMKIGQELNILESLVLIRNWLSYVVTNKYVNEYLHVNFKRFHKLSDEISFKNLIQGLQTVIKNHKKTT